MADKNKSDVCRVCGDKATGFHFSVMTCECCKSFFRRNALNKAGKFRCYLGGNCLINLKNRKTCRKCRLDKSFAVGMKIELFFTDEQKQKRNSIIENNRKRKLTETPVTNVEIAVSTASLSPQTSATFSEDMATLSCSSQSSMDFNNDISSDNSFANILIPENTLNNITNDTNSYDFSQAIVPIVRPITDYSNNFNELEGNRLNELLNGIKILAIPAANSGKRFELNTFPDAMKALITRQETSIQKLVEMCKTIGPFKALCEHDQIILIKYGAIKVKTLRMLLDFDYETQAWTLPNNNQIYCIKLDLFRDVFQTVGNFNAYSDHKSFIMNMGLDWDSETLIIDLLTAILLFNPNQPNLINKHMIKHQQNIYIHLLQRFLQMKYRSDFLSNRKLNRLIENLKVLNIIDHKICGISKFPPALNLLNMCNIQFPPLCLEIYDR